MRNLVNVIKCVYFSDFDYFFVAFDMSEKIQTPYEC